MRSTHGSPTGTVPSAILLAAGWTCIVAGGLVAAVAGPLDLASGSWLAAYLVLVGGVAQVAMGAARTRHLEHERRSTAALSQIATWNGGNACVIGGTLADEPLLVDLGSVLLVVALMIALQAAGPRRDAALSFGGQAARRVPWVYHGLLVLLLVSIPVGVVLSHVRHD